MRYPIHKDAEGRWVHTWVRQSAVKTSDMCLERWRRDVFDTQPEVIKDASMLGTVCHKIAESVLLSAIDYFHGYTDVEMTEADAMQAFGDEWEMKHPTIQVWHSYDSPDAAAEQGRLRLKSWFDEVLPDLTPIQVEHRFEVPLIEDAERVVYLRGTIDLVEGDRLWDWKFPKRDYSRDAWQYHRWDVQSAAYCYAMGIENFSYRIMHPGGVGSIDLVRTQVHYDWLRAKVLALCQLLENQTGAYPLGDNGWWCSDKWCDYFARCKGATIGGT